MCIRDRCNSGQSPQEYYDRLKAFGQFSLPDERYRIASSDNTLLMANALPGTGSFTSMVSGSIDVYKRQAILSSEWVRT